jgi:hypothetical protein
MSAAKLLLLSLLIAVFTPGAQPQTLHADASLTSREASGAMAVVALRGAAVLAATRTLFTAQPLQASASISRVPNKRLILLLAIALMAYQLRRNQRLLNHQLTNR